jgi:predicted TIM-barrel fold metal-dependent hydrolase
MIVDAHTHIGFGRSLMATPDALVRSMKRAGIGRSLVFAGRIGQCSTEALLEAIAPYRDRLFPVGSVSPLAKDRPAPKTVEGWLKKGAVHGLKFYPGYEYFHPHDVSVRPYLELLAEHGKPAIFHSGDTYSKVASAKLKFALPIHIDELAVELPELRIVIAHLGYPWVIDAAEVVYKNTNVYSDCSGFVYGRFTRKDEAHFRRAVRAFLRVAGSADRVIFGSDWPIGDQASYARAAKAVFGPRSAALFSGTAERLFGLPASED